MPISSPNRLARETSPYLLQHAHNPVGWYPWGEEALEKARREDKPILLSIGYAACHWCHVMERESFESESIARLMNEHFVPIKVDREERPDIDEIYMNAVQLMTGSGGWPLTVFLTPDGKPFYGGTYFPPEDRWGRPGFGTLLKEIARVYEQERSRVQESSEALTDRLQSLSVTPPSREMLSRDAIRNAARELAMRFDSREGGFGSAPKFPPSGQLSLLLRYHADTRDPDALSMVALTADKMAASGMYDHLAGGFHRYATDARWLVPHFEKMLYDNALLARCYLEAHQLTGKADYARVARETLDWMLRDMQDDDGGFYSTLDADSEGEEGKYYVWSEDEVQRLLDEDATAFARAYDVSSGGNWEGKNILNRPRPLDEVARDLSMDVSELAERLDSARSRLLEARRNRVPPGLDDKILTSWNGLAIIAMARGYRVLGDDRFLDSARRAASFVLERLVDGDRLLATYREGVAKYKAYLDDHAFLLGGLVELFGCDFDSRWLTAARRLADELATRFHDEAGGFFFTGSDHEPLVARTKSGYDGAIPSGNAMAAAYLLELSVWTGSREYEALATDTMRAFLSQIDRSPSGFPQMLLALDFYLGDRKELAVVSRGGARDALAPIWRHYLPRVTVAHVDPSREDLARFQESVPLVAGKTAADGGGPLYYVCESYACQKPTASLDEALEALGARDPTGGVLE